MLKKYYIHLSKNNNDIDTIILLKSKLSRVELYEQLCAMYKHCDVYVCEYHIPMHFKIINMIDICNLHNAFITRNMQMYTKCE